MDSNNLHILDEFEKISLEAAIKINLNERFDEKFVIHKSDLKPTLICFKDLFLVQSNHNKVMYNYETKYWDTPDLMFFKQHSSQRATRVKVRKRIYFDTNTCFLEIKRKLKGKTQKKRILSEYKPEFTKPDWDFLESNGIETKSLKCLLNTNYKRIILWDKGMNGRITLDLDLLCSHDDKEFIYENICIIEIKGSKSFINKIIRTFPYPVSRFRSSFSKYCIGMLSTYPIQKNEGKELFQIFNNVKKINNKP